MAVPFISVTVTSTSLARVTGDSNTTSKVRLFPSTTLYVSSEKLRVAGVREGVGEGEKGEGESEGESEGWQKRNEG